MLAVRNCCYVAVCSAARAASAPTGGGEGQGHIVAAARLQLVTSSNRVDRTNRVMHGVLDYEAEVLGAVPPST